jgi:Na+-translocating ferredoxin:NAD+ oxidoreductase RnfD subunit
LPDLTLTSSLPLLFLSGGFITWRVNKAPLVLMFLGVYYGLFTVAAFLGDPAHVAEVFIAPDLHAVLFFAFFILTDPPTTPPRYRDQLIYGALVAIVAYATYELLGVVFYLLAGVLVGNVWEALRRLAVQRRRAAHRPAASLAS